jgi:hypothetical protein
MEPLTGTFHDAATGETIVRELTAEEIAQLPEVVPYDLATESPA